MRHRQTHECNSTVACLRALATLNQQKPTGSPELGRSPFWDRPSRALPDPEEMPASDPSRPPVGPTINDVPANPLLVPYIISRQARGERKASAGWQAGRSGQGTQANLRRTGPVSPARCRDSVAQARIGCAVSTADGVVAILGNQLDPGGLRIGRNCLPLPLT